MSTGARLAARGESLETSYQHWRDERVGGEQTRLRAYKKNLLADSTG